MPRFTGSLRDGDCVTIQNYHGTHEAPFLDIAPPRRKIRFETVDVMRIRNGKITEHGGYGESFTPHATDWRVDSVPIC